MKIGPAHLPGPDDASRDLGDSAITETLGLGAPASAAAPALMAFVGGTAAQALQYTAEAGQIYACRGLWPELQIPSMDFEVGLLYIYIYIYTHISIYIYIYIYIHIYISKCKCKCIYICRHMYIYMDRYVDIDRYRYIDIGVSRKI